MSPEISVVIAAYNAEAYIERAMRSALSQENVEVEVVVVNDGSTDDTLAAASGIDDIRVKCLSLARNSGPSAARNTGIAISSAPWVAVLDADDTLMPNRLARLLELARKAKADIVVDNLLVVDETDGKTFPMFKPSKMHRMKTIDLATFIAGNRRFLGGHTLGYLKPVISLEFLRRHRITYRTELRIGEDYMFLAEALASGAVCAVESTPGYQYNLRNASMSHRLSIEDVIHMAEADKRFLARFKLSPAAARAQKRREAALKRGRAFTELVDVLKRRNIAAACHTIRACPPAALQLWRPAMAHLGRIFK